MKDFVRWLVKNDNPFPMVSCVIGAMAVGIVTLGVLYVVAWPLGVLATLGLLFGIPYLMYYSAKKDE